MPLFLVLPESQNPKENLYWKPKSLFPSIFNVQQLYGDFRTPQNWHVDSVAGAPSPLGGFAPDAYDHCYITQFQSWLYDIPEQVGIFGSPVRCWKLTIADDGSSDTPAYLLIGPDNSLPFYTDPQGRRAGLWSAELTKGTIKFYPESVIYLTGTMDIQAGFSILGNGTIKAFGPGAKIRLNGGSNTDVTALNARIELYDDAQFIVRSDFKGQVDFSGSSNNGIRAFDNSNISFQQEGTTYFSAGESRPTIELNNNATLDFAHPGTLVLEPALVMSGGTTRVVCFSNCGGVTFLGSPYSVYHTGGSFLLQSPCKLIYGSKHYMTGAPRNFLISGVGSRIVGDVHVLAGQFGRSNGDNNRMEMRMTGDLKFGPAGALRIQTNGNANTCDLIDITGNIEMANGTAGQFCLVFLNTWKPNQTFYPVKASSRNGDFNNYKQNFLPNAAIPPLTAFSRSWTNDFRMKLSSDGGQDEEQEVTFLPAAPDIGSFTISFDGETSDPIDVANETLESLLSSALQALASVGTGNASVVAEAANKFSVLFVNDLGQTDQPAISVDPAPDGEISLGIAATFGSGWIHEGEFGTNAVQNLTLTDNPNSGTFTLQGVSMDSHVSAGTMETLLEGALGVGVAVTGAFPSWTITWDDDGPRDLLTYNGSGLTSDLFHPTDNAGGIPAGGGQVIDVVVGVAGIHAVQIILLAGQPDAGYWRLSGSSDYLAHDADGTAVTNALIGLGVDAVSDSGGTAFGNPYTITWNNTGPQTALTALAKADDPLRKLITEVTVSEKTKGG